MKTFIKKLGINAYSILATLMFGIIALLALGIASAEMWIALPLCILVGMLTTEVFKIRSVIGNAVDIFNSFLFPFYDTLDYDELINLLHHEWKCWFLRLPIIIAIGSLFIKYASKNETDNIESLVDVVKVMTKKLRASDYVQ